MVCGAALPVDAADTVFYRNVKTIGMGDARIAGGHNYNGFIDNPALLSRIKYVRLGIIPVPFMINENTLDVAKFISDNQDQFQEFDDLDADARNTFLDALTEHDGKWGRAGISPMVSIATNIAGYGFGAAIYNTNDLRFKMDRGIFEPRVWGEGTSNFVGVVGFARPLSMFVPGLTVGANFKLIQRRTANMFQIPASDLGNITDTIQPIADEYNESKHNTFAMDIGALYDVAFIDTEFGAVLQSLGDGRGASLNIGAAKLFWNDKILVLADYIDFLDNNKENMFNKLHIGGEFRFLFLKLRAGLNSGYPTLGLGINFKIIDVDVAYYTDELGNAPGMNEDQRYAVQIKFGW